MSKIASLDQSFIGQTITLKGCVGDFRSGKSMCFIDLYDGPMTQDKIQCFGKTVVIKKLGEIYKQAYIQVQGKVKELPEEKRSFKCIELEITDILHHSPSHPDLIERIQEGCGTRIARELPHLHARHKDPMLFVKLHDLVTRSLGLTAQAMGLVHIDAPSFGSVKCEGGSDVFEMDYFSKQVYFTQSSQMYLEYVTGAIKQGTWCSQYSYRAEKSRTKRHLTQFKHFEVEVPGFVGESAFDDFIEFLKTFIKTLFTILEKEDTDKVLEALGRKEFVKSYVEKEFVILSHEDAIKMLVSLDYKKADGTSFKSHDDIPEAAERMLIDKIDSIVLLTKFPAMTKAFYAKSDPSDKTRALAVDVEFPFVGEIIGSSLRESSFDDLHTKLKLFTLRDTSDEVFEHLEKVYPLDHTIASKKDLVAKLIDCQDAEFLESTLLEIIKDFDTISKEKFGKKILEIPYKDYDWYMDLRKYGFQMTGGFGLGCERLVTWLAGGSYDILDSTTFIRTCDIASP